MNNEKVGHVKATMAKALAPIMDGISAAHRHTGNGNYGMKLLGSIPGRGNSFTLPLLIEFALHARNRESLTASLVELWQRKLALELEKSYLSFEPKRNLSQGGESSQSSDSQRKVSIETLRVDWKTQLQKLDEMFEKGSKEQLSKLPKDAPLPTQYFQDSIQFYPHQGKNLSFFDVYL